MRVATIVSCTVCSTLCFKSFVCCTSAVNTEIAPVNSYSRGVRSVSVAELDRDASCLVHVANLLLTLDCLIPKLALLEVIADLHAALDE